MYVCLCMYVYVYLCICTFMYVYVCICIYMYVYAYICTCMYVYVCACICVYLHVSVCMCMWLYLCAYVCICKYMYVYIFICRCMDVFICLWMRYLSEAGISALGGKRVSIRILCEISAMSIYFLWPSSTNRCSHYNRRLLQHRLKTELFCLKNVYIWGANDSKIYYLVCSGGYDASNFVFIC